jgi:hypothetical protein
MIYLLSRILVVHRKRRMKLMARHATNKLLKKAKTSKSDEFYTQLCDIERELQYYPNSFKIVFWSTK